MKALSTAEEETRIEALRREIQKGLNGGPAKAMDMNEIIAEARREADPS